jgi:hypothetical protein
VSHGTAVQQIKSQMAVEFFFGFTTREIVGHWVILFFILMGDTASGLTTAMAPEGVN